MRGAVTGSEEAFPAETLSAAHERSSYVRNSVGLSHNVRNNVVYGPRCDWVLIGPADCQTHIKPKLLKKWQIAFFWEGRGSDLEVVFHPGFSQRHEDLK